MYIRQSNDMLALTFILCNTFIMYNASALPATLLQLDINMSLAEHITAVQVRKAISLLSVGKFPGTDVTLLKRYVNAGPCLVERLTTCLSMPRGL